MVTGADVSAEARKWLGTRFEHQGRNEHGIDCAGLVENVLRGLNLLPDGYNAPLNYSRLPSGVIERVVSDNLLLAPRDYRLKPGVILLYTWRGEKHAGHLAFSAGDTIIHACQRVGAVVEISRGGAFERFISSVWAVRGVNYE